MPRPKLYEQARELRIEKGFTQREVAELYGKSQTFITMLETGKRDMDHERAYLKWIRDQSPTRRRTAGGAYNAGRVLANDPSVYRGEPLDPDFDHLSTFPQGERWRLLAVCRSAPHTEIAYVFNPDQQCYGIVGFHRIDGVISRGLIIRTTEEYDQNVSLSLIAFANGDYPDLDTDDEEVVDSTPRDGGLLAQDVESGVSL